VGYLFGVCQRLGGNPASVSDFQRRKPKFGMGSGRNARRLEVHYVEEGLDYRLDWIRIAENALSAIC
jgi:hypothetical protein